MAACTVLCIYFFVCFGVYNLQEKLRRGLQAETRDLLGFDLAAPPPETNALNTKLKEALERHMGILIEQEDMREQQWVSCQCASRASYFIQLLRDSMHLLQQAGDNLLLVGLLTNPKETSLGKNKKSLFRRLKEKVSKAASKLLRMPPFQAQHATLAAVIPDYPKVALFLKELSNIYHNNPTVFASTDVFQRAAETLFDDLQDQFFSPQTVPPAVRKPQQAPLFVVVLLLHACMRACMYTDMQHNISRLCSLYLFFLSSPHALPSIICALLSPRAVSWCLLYLLICMRACLYANGIYANASAYIRTPIHTLTEQITPPLYAFMLLWTNIFLYGARPGVG